MASCFRGAFPPVDLRAVCFVRAMLNVKFSGTGMKEPREERNLYVARCDLIGSNFRHVIGGFRS